MDRVTLSLAPGENGSKRLADYFGDRLVCVRYRKTHDGQSYKTIELRLPSDITPMLIAGKLNYRLDNQNVKLNIQPHESHLQRKLKQAGGQWSREQRAWIIEKHKAYALGLSNRVID